MDTSIDHGQRSRRKRIVRIFIAAAAMLWLALFVFFAGHDSIWFDELFSIAQSRLPLHELLRIAAADIHPPGYPVVLKIFLRLFGDSWFVARIFSVFTVFSAGAVMVGYCSDRRVGIASAGCFLLLPAVGFCAQDIRMYGLSMFFLAVFIVCANRIVAREHGGWGDFCGLGIAAWGSALTLNYAVPYLFVPAVWMIVSLWRGGRRKDCWIAIAVLAAAALAYSPWLPCAWGQLTRVRGAFWAPPLTLKACILIFDMPFMGYSLNFISTLVMATAVCFLPAASALGGYRGDRARCLRLWYLAAAAVFPAVVGVVLSLLRGRTLIIDRAMLPACVPLALMFGEAFASPVVRRGFKVSAAAVMAIFFVYHSCCIVYRTRDGALPALRDCLNADYAGKTLYYSEAHDAATAAGVLPRRRHTVISSESDPMGMLILGNVDVAEPPLARGNGRIFILGEEESPTEFLRRAQGVGELRLERSFYSRYRFQHFKICRESVTP